MPEALLYFGYGSNLDDVDWRAWCGRRGVDPGVLRPLRPAWLPDEEPAFRYRSTGREGGVLDLRPRPGSATPGALFEVRPGGWEALDAKEDEGRVYRRVERIALTDDGERVPVLTYELLPARRAAHVPPSDAYLAVVARGYARFGHPDEQLRAAAAGRPPPCRPSAVFCYGTLMSGEARHPAIADAGPIEIAPARAPGRLLDLGACPALVAAAGERVEGELVRFADVGAVTATLDAIEGFFGHDAPGCLYHRVIVRVEREGGGAEPAWTYRYAREPRGAPAIASGSWRRRGARDQK